jgi:hypothetical protein
MRNPLKLYAFVVFVLGIFAQFVIDSFKGTEVQESISQATGEIKCFSTRKGRRQRLELNTSNGKLVFPASLDEKDFPCSSQIFTNTIDITNKGIVRYHAYETAPTKLGAGIIESVQVGGKLFAKNQTSKRD